MVTLLITLLVIAFCTYAIGRYSFRQQKTDQPRQRQEKADCASCAMFATACNDGCSVDDEQEEVIYFDDEELDQYARRPSDTYSDEEIDAFAEVLHTMRDEEVPQWLQSLKQRGINLPDELKEDVSFFIG